MISNLEADHIHLWLTFSDEIRDCRLLASYRSLLSKQEQDRQQRFHFVEDQHRYLITRAMLRAVLSHYSCVKPQNWLFRKNAHGRPEVANTCACSKSISFSISHTAGLILCGIARKHPLGVDTENIKCVSAHLGVATLFSRVEAAALAELPQHKQPERLLQLWTLKESYIKAQGRGLTIPLDKFSFHFQRECIIVPSFDRALEDSPRNWQFWLLGTSVDHVAAVCAYRTAGARQRLTMRRLIPLESEEPFHCAILGESRR